MGMRVIAADAALAAGGGGSASPAADAPGSAAPRRPSAGRRRVGGWWRAWRARFGLAEVCGTVGAVGGFAAGYLPAGSLVAAAGLATVCEVIGFYGCVGAKAALAARRATAHLAGWRRLAAGAWHAVTEQLASCAAAEVLDDLLIRPGCLAGAAWLARPLPGGLWLGFAAGKAAADVAWYGTEALARWGPARPRRRDHSRMTPEVRATDRLSVYLGRPVHALHYRRADALNHGGLLS
jgi:hypothetical protein